MTGKDLLNKMELVEPEYIEAADKKPRKKPVSWQQWVTVAACLTAMIVSGIMLFMSPDTMTVPVNTPVDTATVFSGGGICLAVFLAASLILIGTVMTIIVKNQKK